MAAAAALSQDLPILDPGDDVFNVGADAPVGLVVVVVDGATSGRRRGPVMVSMPRYPPSPRNDTASKRRGHGVAGHDDVVVGAGRASSNRPR
jgi:hypothetical protein